MKNLSLTLGTLLLVTACSKSGSEKQTVIIRESAPLSSNLTTSDQLKDEIEVFKKLLQTKSPNLALAEFIGSALSKEKKEELADVLKDVSGDEINKLIQAIETSNKEVRKNYLYHGKGYGDNSRVTENALVRGEQGRDYTFSFRNQMTISAFSYMRGQALNEILDSYQKEANELSQDIIQDIAEQMGSYPSQATEIEKAVRFNDFDKAKLIISENLVKLKILNHHFNNSNLTKNERYVALATETIVRNIYIQIKKQKEFKNIVAEIKRAQKKIDSINTKINQFIVLTSTIESHIESTKNNFNRLGTGMKTAVQEMGQIYRQVEGKGNGVQTKRVMDYLSDKLYGGNKLKDFEILKTDSILSSKVKNIENNLSDSMKAIGDISNNLSSILDTSKGIADLLGVKIPSKVVKVIDKAQKIANVVSMGSAVVDICTTGGAMTALSAFSGGSMLGGGDNSAQFAAINQKLDQVLKNQELMMKAQLETMKMIKNLAILVDEYHQKEMSALSELRDYGLISLEIQKAALVHPEIRSCEHLINYNLYSVWRDYNFQKLPFDNINYVQMFKSKFSDRIVGLRGIRDIIEGTGTDDFIKCQQAFVKAFGVTRHNENPLLAIFETDERNNLQKFNRNVYLPTLATVVKFSDNNNLNSVPLHLPMKDMRHLEEKSDYLHDLAKVGNYYDDQADIYSLDNLISVKNLERYVSNLVLLYPLFEFSQNDWHKSLDELVEKKLLASAYESKIKGHYYLSGALKYIQSAIAQEAMMAGEPILTGLNKNYHAELLSNKSCDGIVRFNGNNSDWELLCALRSNTLLMKNYLDFSVYKRIEKIVDYTEAYSNNNFKQLAQILNVHLSSESFEVADKVIYIKLNGFDPMNEKNTLVKIALPQPEVLHKAQISYSENMDRLLTMQEVVLSEIEKVHPLERKDVNYDILSKYILRTR